MIASLVLWIKKNSTILFNTGSLIATMVVTSALGFAYWLVAARLFIPEAVGLASATTSAMMSLSTFCLMGMGTLLITEIPRNKGQEGPIISTALLLVGGVSLIVGTIFAVSSSFISPALHPIGANIQNITLFAISISITAITVIVDQAVIGLLKGGLQFWRNTLFSVAKLVALYLVSLWLTDKIGMTIYATWTLGNVLSLIPLLGVALWKNRYKLSNFLPRWDLPRKIGAAAFQHHVLNLIIQTPSQLLPLLVTVLLSAKTNAWFYVAAMIANFVFSISFSLTTVLHATNAAQRTTLSQKTRVTTLLATITSVITCSILMLGAEALLSFFGHSYAQQAALPLRILSLGAFPLIIKNHYIAIRRIKDEITNAMIPITLGSVLELVLAATGARLGGLVGLSLGWVIALSFESLFMARFVFRTVAGKDPVADTISSSIDADTLILTAIRPGIFNDPLDQIIDAPTQKMSAIIGLSSSIETIRNQVFMDAPTIEMGRIHEDEQLPIKLPGRVQKTTTSTNNTTRGELITPIPEEMHTSAIADAPITRRKRLSRTRLENIEKRERVLNNSGPGLP